MISYNGEVYNFPEIRRELEKLGTRFRSDSDTEVVLQSFCTWRTDALNRFNGMFAIALWDRCERQLFLARDRLGVKPLYYTVLPDRTIFASEIKAFYADPAFKAELDEEALAQYLSVGYTPWPQTLFRGVWKIPPGHFAVWKEGALTLARYWDPAAQNPKLSPAAQSDLFADAVQMRLRSDVPVGLFLSGGVDSAYVAAIAAQQKPDICSFTVGFDVPNSRHDESALAQETAAGLAIRNETVLCGRSDEEALLPTLIWHLDEPVAENLIVPTFRLCETARRRFTVALSGEGADEAFCGYRYYTLEIYRKKLAPALRPIAPILARVLRHGTGSNGVRVRTLRYLLAPNEHVAFAEWAQCNFIASDLAALLGREVSIENLFVGMRRRGNLHFAETRAGALSSLYDLQYRMVDYILSVRDKMSMAASLELRSPFLDYRLVEAALANETKALLSPRMTKIILRRMASASGLPDRIAYRKKKPFASPVDVWLVPLARQWLQNSELARDGYLNQGEIDRWLTLLPNHRSKHPQQIVTILNLELWYRIFITRSMKPRRDLTPTAPESVPVWESLRHGNA